MTGVQTCALPIYRERPLALQGVHQAGGFHGSDKDAEVGVARGDVDDVFVGRQTFTIDKALKINDQNGRQSNIIATDVAASNGVVHLIDKVILPK